MTLDGSQSQREEISWPKMGILKWPLTTHLIVAAMQNLKGALTNSLFDATVRFLLSKLSKLS